MLKLDLNSQLAARFSRAMNENPKKVDDSMEISLTEIALFIHGKAGTWAPYDTGNLRRSLNWKANSREARIGSNLVYARIHDLGGQAGRGRKVRIPKYKGRGYLTPAFEIMKNGEAIKIVEKNLKKALK